MTPQVAFDAPHTLYIMLYVVDLNKELKLVKIQ